MAICRGVGRERAPLARPSSSQTGVLPAGVLPHSCSEPDVSRPLPPCCLGKESPGAFLYLLVRQVTNMGGNRTRIPERILQHAATATPEGILHRHRDCRAGRTGDTLCYAIQHVRTEQSGFSLHPSLMPLCSRANRLPRPSGRKTTRRRHCRAPESGVRHVRSLARRPCCRGSPMARQWVTGELWDETARSQWSCRTPLRPSRGLVAGRYSVRGSFRATGALAGRRTLVHGWRCTGHCRRSFTRPTVIPHWLRGPTTHWSEQRRRQRNGALTRRRTDMGRPIPQAGPDRTRSANGAPVIVRRSV
jgi:hypothetical protein